jgi:hypothetical protein
MPNQPMMSKQTTGPLPLIATLLLAALLRVWGLTWGLPSATHYYSYHTDETVVLQAAMFNMNLFAGHLLPHFYNYGSLQLYLVNIANSLAFVFGGVDIVPKDFAAWYPQWSKMYLIGRSLTVAMGVGTVGATYALGSRLWGRRAGLLAALVLAVIPLHAQHSHWLTVDVPATFWVTLSLLWTARLATGDARPLRAALLAGVFAGLATATKYNMALVLLPLVIVCLLHSPADGKESSNKGKRGRFLAIGIVSAVVAFLVACPGAVLESGRFVHDLRFEAVHVNNPDDPTFKDTGSGFVYQITQNLNSGLGLPLLILVLASVGYVLFRRERGDGLLAAFALPYFLLISFAAVRYARYVVPLLPVVALWAGRLLSDLARLRQTVPRRAAVTAGALVVLLTLGDCLWLISPMAQTDPRDRADAWLTAHAPAPTPIGFPVQPWFGTVPVSPYFCAPGRGEWQRLESLASAARIIYTGTDWDTRLLQSPPPFIVLSEYDYRDPMRLHDPQFMAFMTALPQTYQPVFLASAQGAAVGRGQSGLPIHRLPFDMLYTNPAIIIYRRKS